MEDQLIKFLNGLSEEDINIIKKWLEDRDKKPVYNFKDAALEIVDKFKYSIRDISYFKEFNNQDIIFFYDEYKDDLEKYKILNYLSYFGKLFISCKDDNVFYEVIRLNDDNIAEIINLDRSAMLKVPNFICLKYGILEFLKRR